MGKSRSDRKKAYLIHSTGATSPKGSIADFEISFYTTKSGLTPVGAYTLSDHKKAYLKKETGLTSESMANLWRAFYLSKGIPITGGFVAMERAYLEQQLATPAKVNLLTAALATCDTTGKWGNKSCSQTADAVNKIEGAASIKVTCTTAGTIVGLHGGANRWEITPGQKVSMSVSVLDPIAREHRVELGWYDGAGIIIAKTAIGTPVPANAWTRIHGTWVIPDGAVTIGISSIGNASLALNEFYNIDQAQLNIGDPQPWELPAA